MIALFLQAFFSFVPISEIFGAGFNSDYLVDVMGILTIARTEREYERNGKKSKMSVIELESDGFKIECTLFGTYADELASFISSGEHENAVVLIQFAKVKTFQGKTVLQNTMYTTKLFFNPDFPEAIEFRKRFAERSESPTQLLTQLHDSSRVSISDDFLVLTARNTIEGLKDSKEEATYVVLATIKHIVDEGDWWYSACTCNKAVYPDSKLYYCEKCDHHIMNVTPRYRIKVRVIDHTDSATFVIFDRDAALLFKKSCAEMIQAAGKGVGSLTLPNEISHLVEQTFLFKVEFKDVSNSKFEQTFRVKRMTNDPNIVNRFLELGPPASGGCLAAVLPDVAVDLLPQFCDVIESQSTCGVKNAVDLSLDSGTMNAVNIQDKDVVAGNISAASPVKGGFPADGGDGVGTFAVKKLKKDIKIEKE